MKKTMESQELNKSIFLLQPSRPILCTTKNEDGSDHVAPFSWVNPVSFNPPRIALALSNSPKKQNSLINIERTGEFVINMPDMRIADKMIEASYSTKFGENKFIRSGFTGEEASAVAPKIISECQSHLECRVIEIIEPGDHKLIIADVVGASYNQEAYGVDLHINTQNFQPVIHMNDYCLEGSQLHLLANIQGTVALNVPYPSNNKDQECK
ncbi:MAG: flavin reductase family protein [Eubacteriales bacterium]|nr:flavin reductase family protein [Eubacteriales bacterium]